MNLIEINQKSEEFKMLASNILVELEEFKAEVEQKTESGIIFQTANQNSAVVDRNTFGRVVAVGPEVEEIKTGDFVFWHITSGVEVQFRDGPFMVLRADTILGCSK